MITIDLGVFAHNEASCIGQFIEDLARQTLFGRADFNVRALILANGCTDDTEQVARAALARTDAAFQRQCELVMLQQGGKSRTWNEFTHRLSRPDAEFLLFLDADIRLPQADTLARMIEALIQRPELATFVSCPVKDIVHDRLQVGPIARLIALGGGTLFDFKISICGQLYALRAGPAREVHMPVGLPVEDGFLREMLLTHMLTRQGEDLSRIDGDADVFHVYESIRSVRELLRHQVRIVIGSAINLALFRRLRQMKMSHAQLQRYLADVSQDDDWVRRTIRQELPQTPHGYVPFAFLNPRMRSLKAALRERDLRRLPSISGGVVMDVIVYLMASVKMARGVGANYW
ncbi:MAG: glycosyltransferase family 2 protein [Burkholderiaceae bacterium]